MASFLESTSKNRSLLDLVGYWGNSSKDIANPNDYNKVRGSIEELVSAYDNRTGNIKSVFEKGLASGDKFTTDAYNSILSYKSNVNQQKKSLNQGLGGAASVLGGSVN